VPRGPAGAFIAGLSRKAIFAEIDASLTRLGMDYVDLYQIHRWTMTLRSRRHSRRCTTSSRLARHATLAPRRCLLGSSPARLASPRSVAGHASSACRTLVNLLYREEEREMLPLSAAEGSGVIPWSPQARGKLTRHWGLGLHQRPHRSTLRRRAISTASRLNGHRFPVAAACYDRRSHEEEADD